MYLSQKKHLYQRRKKEEEKNYLWQFKEEPL